MTKFRYNINNLDCANCAKNIENTLNKDENLKNVIVNFNTCKISYETDNISIEEINALINNIEPGVIVSEDIKQTKEYHLVVLIISVCLGIIGDFYSIIVLTIIAYILLLYRPLYNAFKTIIKSKSINENALICISCIGAFLVGESLEGIMVASLYILGKLLEEKAINNTRKSIKSLLDIKQDFANIKLKDKIEIIKVEEIKIDAILVVKKGEKVPVDGIVVSGSTKLDMSSLTGESNLVIINTNDNILSGSINEGEIIEIKATSIYKDSTVFKILQLVEEATDKKANTETLVSRLSKIYTPVILLLALIVAFLLPLLTDISIYDSIYRGLTFLVISCPCAIAISVPLSYFTGIGTSSKNGILIKGSNYLDNLSHINKIVFDKTGTLTNGTFEVENISIVDSNYSKEDIINIMIQGESLSNHPIAQSIMKLGNIETNSAKKYKEIAGQGIEYEIMDKKIKLGSNKICTNCSVVCDLHLNIDGKHTASIYMNDGIKENASEVISNLHNLNIKTYMFTGDKKDIALSIGKKLSIDEIKYEMLPVDKYKQYELIHNKEDLVAFIGDGINDAPTLKRADIGISMGNIGSSAAIEASDIVIMTDDLSKIYKAINISKYTNKIIKQNLIFAIGVKAIILLLSIFGITTMWAAVFADTGVTLLTILNTLRIMNKFKVVKTK